MHALCFFVFAVLAAPLIGSAFAAESCVTCHPDSKVEYEASIHAPHFSCTACHGGNADVLTLDAHDATKGYIGKPKRTEIPAVCGSCHSDAARMRAFDLPTDQYAQYQQSRHGLLLKEGDNHVAVCTDCHGVHRIVSRDEPTSPVAAANVPATCGRCHADQDLMSTYGIPSDQLEKFNASVHAKALFVDQHPAAPNCATCHGAHGANELPTVTIATVCGHCHERTRQYFEQSAHQKAVAAGTMTECVSCHGSHAVMHPDHDLFDTTCPTCHVADSPGFAAAQRLKTLVVQAEDSLETAGAAMDAAAPTYPTVVRYRDRLRQGRAYLMQALPMQHSLDLDRVADLTRSARSVGDDVRAEAYGRTQEARLRYGLLAIAWVFILFAATVTRLYQRERRLRQ